MKQSIDDAMLTPQESFDRLAKFRCEITYYREALQKILCTDTKWSRDIAKRALDHFKP